jgi:F-type H+-transporting ATPase subunit a
MSLRRFFKKISFAQALIFAFFLHTLPLAAENAPAVKAEGSTFDTKEAIMHHLLDNYDWEFFKRADGTPVKLCLPRILIRDGQLKFYKSTDAAVADGFVEAREYNPEAKHGDLLKPGAEEALHPLKEEVEKAATPEEKAAKEKALISASADYKVADFSITKNVVFMLIAAFLLFLVFGSVARGYKKNHGKAPKGIQSFFEPIVLFVRDDIAKENIPNQYEKFTPLLLTMFFFIWFLNMMGMVPFSSNVSGNISFTLTLALVSLVVVNIYANKSYWKHIFWPPVPHAIKPIMVPLEIVSIFTKPFALTIRLFANISGGHVVMISLLSLIFIFGKMGQEAIAGWGVGIFSTLFIVAISLLELFIALLQAYVFTLLTALFIGQAVAEEEHH